MEQCRNLTLFHQILLAALKSPTYTKMFFSSISSVEFSLNIGYNTFEGRIYVIQKKPSVWSGLITLVYKWNIYGL